ncbi:MAG: type II toxin-antitoxin system PemK/MazF family toxin [Pirellulales bacterium]
MKRGEIVIVDLPFTDDSGSKPRPALVVQSDPMNQLVADTIVASITSTTHRAATIPTQVIVDPSVETASRLLHTSVIRCENLRAID